MRPQGEEAPRPPQAGGSLFPCGLPYLDRTARRAPVSGRRRQRWQRERRRRLAVDAMVAYSSWLAPGRPSGGPSAGLVAAALTPMQRSCVKAFEQQLAGVSRPGTTISVELGGCSRTLNTLLNQLDLSSYTQQQNVSALPLWPDPDLTSVPARGAQVELKEPVVPSLYAELLREPGAF